MGKHNNNYDTTINHNPVMVYLASSAAWQSSSGFSVVYQGADVGLQEGCGSHVFAVGATVESFPHP